MWPSGRKPTIQEEYRLYNHANSGTLIIGTLYVSTVFVCMALAILSIKTLSTWLMSADALPFCTGWVRM